MNLISTFNFWLPANTNVAAAHAGLDASSSPLGMGAAPLVAFPPWPFSFPVARIRSWLHETSQSLQDSALSWLGLKQGLSCRLPMLVSAMMTVDPTDGDSFAPESDPVASGLRLAGSGPEGPEPENESVQEATSLLLSEAGTGHCRRLCASLQWLTPNEMAQVIREAFAKAGKEELVSRLSLAASQAVTENEHFLLIQLLSSALSVSNFSGTPLLKILDDMGKKLPVNAKREKIWSEWETLLTSALDSWNPADPSAAGRIDGLLATFRNASWRTGFPSPVIDRLINASPYLDSRRTLLCRYFLYAVGHLVRARGKEQGLMSHFFEIQYVTDRIAASGDLVRAKVLIEQTIESVRGIEKKSPTIHASYIAKRLQILKDGITTALYLTMHPTPAALADAVSAYRSPDYTLLPPVHIVIRGLRLHVSSRSVRGKISAESVSSIHAAVREMAKLRVVDPLLMPASQDAPAIADLRSRLLEALERGDEFTGQEWGALMAEAADVLSGGGLLSQAHDLMRAFHKMGVCEPRIFSGIAMSLVTNAEIALHKTRDSDAREKLAHVRDRLVEWQETFDY